jgi:ketopantoate hydroxymethyltransferase
MARAFAAYKADVEARAFPAQEHSIDMPDEEWAAFLREVA